MCVERDLKYHHPNSKKIPPKPKKGLDKSNSQSTAASAKIEELGKALTETDNLIKEEKANRAKLAEVYQKKSAELKKTGVVLVKAINLISGDSDKSNRTNSVFILLTIFQYFVLRCRNLKCVC